MRNIQRAVIALVGIISGSIAPAARAELLLTPAPRELEMRQGRLPLDGHCAVVTVGAAAEPVAALLVHEMNRLHGIALLRGADARPSRTITLVLRGSEAGKTWAAQHAEIQNWKPRRNPDEAYWLDVDIKGALIVADSPRGLWYGCQTLLQLVEGSGEGKSIAAAAIRDWPQLPFRSVHICIFPNTELPAVRQAILLASRFKYNAVVLEFWSSLKSKKRPETAYESAYSPGQIKPLIELGRSLQMEMIPMLNSWGHASGMRSTSFEHAVLDRHPEFKDLFEPDGWSFNLSNPKIYDHLFDRYDELLELFGPVKYFHLGLDEAWGHLGLMEAKGSRGDDPRKLLTGHLKKIQGYFAKRNIKVFMWHDMFIQRDHPKLGKLSPANSVPPVNTHLVLPELPRDVIMAAWNYGAAEWPVPKYFKDEGFPVVVCPWKHRKNTVGLVNIAKREDLMGVMATTWDSLDVALPSLAQAGVLAWTQPDHDLKRVPFDHWVRAIRSFPIDKLPRLEECK